MRVGIFSVVDGYPDEVDRSTGQFYDELLDQCQLADELGFDSFWIAEHHFHQYGTIPRAAIWLAAAAQRTKRIRLGAAVVVLPFDNPLRTAEDYAMVDVLSHGRLSLGVGSGYLKHEFGGFGLSMEDKRERFDESLEILQKAWSGDKFSFNGQFNQIDNLSINVVPVQKPAPPLAVAILNNEAARFVGQRGFDVMLIPYASLEQASQLSGIVGAYEQGRSEGNHSTGGRVYVALHTYCGETSKQARTDLEPCMDRYVRTRLFARQRTVATLEDANLLAVGDPEKVGNLMSSFEAMGVTDFLSMTNFGGLPHQNVCDSMKRIALCHAAVR